MRGALLTAALLLLLLPPLAHSVQDPISEFDTLTDLLLHHGSGPDSVAVTLVSSLAPPPRYVSVDRAAGPDWYLQWQDEDAVQWTTPGQQPALTSGYTLPQRTWPLFPPWPGTTTDLPGQVIDSPTSSIFHQSPGDGLAAHRSDFASATYDDATSYVTPLSTGDASYDDLAPGQGAATNGSGLKEVVRDTLASIFEKMLRKPNSTEVGTGTTELDSEAVLDDQVATASTVEAVDGRRPSEPCSNCDDAVQWTPLLLPGSGSVRPGHGSSLSSGSGPGAGPAEAVNVQVDLGTGSSQWVAIGETADAAHITSDFDLAVEPSHDSLATPNGLQSEDYSDSGFSSDLSAVDFSNEQYRYEDQIHSGSGTTERVFGIWSGLKRKIRRLFPSWRYLTSWRTPWWCEGYSRKRKKKHKGHKRPRPSYGAPRPKPKPSYGAPRPKPKPSYGPPKSKPKPKPSYGPPKSKPSPSYGPPKSKPKPSYGPPKLKPKPFPGPPKSRPNHKHKPKPSYGPPNDRPKSSYGPPKAKQRPSYRPPKAKPKPSYGPPKAKPKPSYGPPKAKPKPSYGPPSSKPNPSYGAAKSKRPSQLYGPPYTKPSSSYGPPNHRVGSQITSSPRVQQYPTTYSPESTNFGSLDEASLDAHTLDPVIQTDEFTEEPPSRLHRPHRPQIPHKDHDSPTDFASYPFPSFNWVSAPFRAAYDWQMDQLGGLLRRVSSLPRVLLPNVKWKSQRHPGGGRRSGLRLQFTDGQVPDFAAPALLQERSGLLGRTGMSRPVQSILSALVLLPFALFALERGAALGEMIGNSTASLWIVDSLTREGGVPLSEAGSGLLRDLETLRQRCPDARRSNGTQRTNSGRKEEAVPADDDDARTDEHSNMRDTDADGARGGEQPADEDAGRGEQPTDEGAGRGDQPTVEFQPLNPCPSDRSAVGRLVGSYRALTGGRAAPSASSRCRPVVLCRLVRDTLQRPADRAAALTVLAARSAAGQESLWSVLRLAASFWTAADGSSTHAAQPCQSYAADSCTDDYPT